MRSVPLIRERNGYRTENIFFLLGFKLFCLVYVGITHFTTTHYEAETSHDVGCEEFLIHTVAFFEGIAVKEDVMQDSM